MSFFKPRSPRKFEYQPRFYDPSKEELKRLKAKYGKAEGESYKRRIDFRAAMTEKRGEKHKKPYPALKIFLSIFIVIALLYVLLEIVGYLDK